MGARMIEHWGMVRAIDDGLATVVVETTACGVCGHDGHCGVGRVSAGRQATTLSLPAVGGLKVGDFVNVGLPEAGLSFAALVGYLLPALATLLGAGLGYATGGGDSATALGAAGGFAASLVAARIALGLMPGFAPRPQILPPSSLSANSLQEQEHD